MSLIIQPYAVSRGPVGPLVSQLLTLVLITIVNLAKYDTNADNRLANSCHRSALVLISDLEATVALPSSSLTGTRTRTRTGMLVDSFTSHCHQSTTITGLDSFAAVQATLGTVTKRCDSCPGHPLPRGLGAHIRRRLGRMRTTLGQNTWLSVLGGTSSVSIEMSICWPT